MGTIYSELESRGLSFRKQLSAVDVESIILARDFFNALLLITTALYYVGASEDPKFPATISWTVRKGLPKYVHHVVWALGWKLMSNVFENSGDPFAVWFSRQMIVTGVVTTWVAPVGRNAVWSDTVHFWGALLYMIDHIVLFFYLGTTLTYRVLFYVSLITMGSSIVGIKLLGVPPLLLEQSDQRLSERLTAVQCTRLYWLELSVMASENVMFVAFITGMASGLPHRNSW